jgi:hypothetical protein
MARFQKRVDVWGLSPTQRAALQPGQHISAGGAHGRWCGQTSAGVDVAAWQGNAKGHKAGAAAYMRTLRGYARTHGAR